MDNLTEIVEQVVAEAMIEVEKEEEADTRLQLAAVLLSTQSFLVGCMISKNGAMPDTVQLTSQVRNYVDAALLLADHMIRRNGEYGK